MADITIANPQQRAQSLPSSVMLQQAAHPVSLAGVANLEPADTAGQPDSYVTHPASLDATTHTAAVLATLSAPSSVSAEAAVTRIPVALEVYGTPQQHLVYGQQTWCSGVVEAMQADGSVVTGYSIATACLTMARLSGFVAKARNGLIHTVYT